MHNGARILSQQRVSYVNMFIKYIFYYLQLQIVIRCVFNHAKPTAVIALDGNFLHNRYP